jgi:hypothetical protein
MKKKLIVPKFKSEKEEARFWASLDLSEYFEPSDFKRGGCLSELETDKAINLNPAS